MVKITAKEKHNLLLKLNYQMDSNYMDDNKLDFCGGWCNNAILEDMLNYPSIARANKHIISLIERKIRIYENVNFMDFFGCKTYFVKLKIVGVVFRGIDYD